MKLLGGGKRSIVIQFVADTVKAARDIDNLTKKMDRARNISSVPRTSTRTITGTTSAGLLPGMASTSFPRQIKRSNYQGMFDPADSWERGWYRRNIPGAINADTGKRGRDIALEYVKRDGRKIAWQQDLMSRTQNPALRNIDRNLNFLARRRIELGTGAQRPRQRNENWTEWLYRGGAGKKFGGFHDIRAKEQISKLGETAAEAGGGLFNMIGKLAKFGGALGIATLILRAFAKAVGAILGPIFHHGNLIEGNLIQMEIMLGNAQRANKMMQEAIRFSMLTPFTPEQTFGAVATSLQYKIDPFKKGAYGLRRDQNAMQIFAGLGSFRENGRALGVERATHAVLRGDVRRMRPFMGVVQPAYEAAKKKGKIGTLQFNEAFIGELGKIPEIMAMAERHSNSMAGMWSTISGFAEEFWIALSGAGEMSGVTTFWSYLKSIVMDIRDAGIQFMDYIKPGLTEIGAFLGSIFGFIWDMLKAIWKMIAPKLVPALKIVWQLLKAILSFIIGTLKAVSQLVMLYVDIVSIFDNFILDILGFTSASNGFISEIIEFGLGIQMMFQMLNIYIGGIANHITAAFSKMLRAMKEWIMESEIMGRTVREWLALMGGGFGVSSAERKVVEQENAIRIARQNYERVLNPQYGERGGTPEDAARFLTAIRTLEAGLPALREAVRVAKIAAGQSVDEARQTNQTNQQRRSQEEAESREAKRKNLLQSIKTLRGRLREQIPETERRMLTPYLRRQETEYTNTYGPLAQNVYNNVEIRGTIPLDVTNTINSVPGNGGTYG